MVSNTNIDELYELYLDFNLAKLRHGMSLVTTEESRRSLVRTSMPKSLGDFQEHLKALDDAGILEEQESQWRAGWQATHDKFLRVATRARQRYMNNPKYRAYVNRKMLRLRAQRRKKHKR